MTVPARVSALCVAVGLLAAGCGGNGTDPDAAASPDPAAPSSAAPASGGTAPGGDAGCQTLGPAYLRIELAGSVTQTVDWAPTDCGAGFAASNDTSLGFVEPGLDVLVDFAAPAGETVTGVAGRLRLNVETDAGTVSYSTEREGCTVDVTRSELADAELSLWFVEGTGTCDQLGEVGGSGTITVEGQFSFAGYPLGE